MSEQEEIEKVLEEHSKKVKELYKKYPHIEGTLDGGPPKDKEIKIRNETLQKMQRIKKKYNK